MSNDLFQKQQMLPYVDAKYDQPVDSPAVTTIIAPKTNGFALVSIILTGVAFLGAILVVPSVVAIAFSIIALVVSIRRGTSKVLPLISLITSAVLFVTGLVVAALLFSAYDSNHEAPIPANYSKDYVSNLAYKYEPGTQVPCDANGLCTLEIDLLATTDDCSAGGTATQQVFSLSTGYEVPATSVEIPSMKVNDTSTLVFEYQSAANDTLNLVTEPDLRCN